MLCCNSSGTNTARGHTGPTRHRSKKFSRLEKNGDYRAESPPAPLEFFRGEGGHPGAARWCRPSGARRVVGGCPTHVGNGRPGMVTVGGNGHAGWCAGRGWVRCGVTASPSLKRRGPGLFRPAWTLLTRGGGGRVFRVRRSVCCMCRGVVGWQLFWLVGRRCGWA